MRRPMSRESIILVFIAVLMFFLVAHFYLNWS